jgi:hypothetical protein
MTFRRTCLTTFFNDVLQDLTIERQIRDEPLEAAIFFAQLAQFADLGGSEATKAFAPRVERRFGDAELACDFGNRRAGLGLAQRCRDLLVGVAGLAHGRTSYWSVFAAFF